MRVLVTGCGRSGTRYATRAMSAIGVSLGHEKDGEDGRADWHLAADPSGYDLVLHQVRSPLEVVASCYTISDRSWHFMAARSPVRITDPLLVRCMSYWVYWNELAEFSSHTTYRVEDMVMELPRLTGMMGLRWNDNWTVWVDKVPRNIGSRRGRKKHRHKYPELDITMLRETAPFLFWRMSRMAQRYGYENFS